MGQYLAIGIDHKYVVSQDSAEKVGKTLDEIVGVLGFCLICSLRNSQNTNWLRPLMCI